MQQGLLALFLATGLSLSLLSCSKDPNLSNDPSEQSKATSVATRFIEAFATGNSNLAFEMSEVPFWGDGDLILDRQELENQMIEQTENLSPPQLKIKGTMMMSLSQLEIINPELHHQIQKEISTGDVYAISVLLDIEGDEEHGVVLVKRQADGIWKVIGMGN